MGYGKFFVIEGIDGCGKSTLVAGLKERFEFDGYDVSQHEPYGTVFGKTLRNMCNQNYLQITPEAISLLMYASFMEFSDKIIKPALKKGEIVIVDRWYSSTLAYQTVEMEDSSFLLEVHKAAEQILPPVDRFVFLDCSYEVANNRLYGKKKDHFELKGKYFFEEVIDLYKKSSLLNPDVCWTYDGEQTYNEVLEQVYNDLQELL